MNRFAFVALLLGSKVVSAQPTDDAPPVDEKSPEPMVLEPPPTPAKHRRDSTLATGPIDYPLLFADLQHHRFAVELELFGTGAYTDRDGPSFSEFRLDRGELGTTVGIGESVGAEIRFESIRSAGEGGALGIDGDSIVVRVKRAQVFGDYEIGRHFSDVITGNESPWLHLHGALGITPDPWITALESDYPLRPLSATASERSLGWPTSDLAALGRVGYGPIRISVSFGNGEGLDYPERNNGKTTTGVVEVMPIATSDARLRIAGVARDGSVGPARVRDRRFGGAATLWTPLIRAGVELVQAYGIAERGELEALALSGWAELHPFHYLRELAIAARFNTLGYADGNGRASSVGGAISVEAWRDSNSLVVGSYGRGHHPREAFGTARLWLAIDHTTTSGSAMPLPGADAGTATSFMLIVSTTAPFTID